MPAGPKWRSMIRDSCGAEQCAKFMGMLQVVLRAEAVVVLLDEKYR